MKRLVLLLPLLASCSIRNYQPDDFLLVPNAEVVTDGVVIEAEDGSFRLVAGQPMESPFWTYDCPALPILENHGLAKRLGAKPVKITHPSSPRPLHGLLALCPTVPEAFPGLKQSYRIVVPAEKVQAAAAGGLSFVAQPSGYSQAYFTGFMADLPTWILWISPAPL